jgi:hypothetical protein
MTWLFYALLSGFFIGLASFFRKMASKTSGSLGGFLIEGLVYGMLTLLFFLFQQNKSKVVGSNPAGCTTIFTSADFGLLAKGFKPYYTEDVLSHFQTFAHPPAQACFSHLSVTSNCRCLVVREQ